MKPIVFCDGVDVYQEKTKNKNRRLTEEERIIYHICGYGAYLRIKRGAEKRKIIFQLTEEELKNWWINTPDICYYCSISMSEYRKIVNFILKDDKQWIFRLLFSLRPHRLITKMTIDRKDNLKGYVLENIVKSCSICNGFKRNIFTEEEKKKIMVVMMSSFQRCISTSLL